MKLRFAIAALAALSVGGILITAVTPAHAQAAKRQRRNAGGRQEPVEPEAFKASGASADAQTKFETLFTTYQADRKAVPAATGTEDQKERRTKLADLEKKFHSDADALLAPDQVTKYHQGLTAIPIMRNLDRNLMLTSDEKGKIEPLLDDYATKTDGMKAKEKKNAETELKPKLREVLTTDQQTKFDTLPSLTGGGNGRRNNPAAPVAPLAPPPPAAPGAPANP